MEKIFFPTNLIGWMLLNSKFNGILLRFTIFGSFAIFFVQSYVPFNI
uniref:Uncharacterized protein n=1 Tax=Rhizophora mucronata TaxID=61149 RepID=A0A2P2NCG5_RHIMU